MPKFKLWIATDRVGSKTDREVEVDAEEWEELSETERDEYMYDELMNSCMFEWGFNEVE